MTCPASWVPAASGKQGRRTARGLEVASRPTNVNAAGFKENDTYADGRS